MDSLSSKLDQYSYFQIVRNSGLLISWKGVRPRNLDSDRRYFSVFNSARSVRLIICASYTNSCHWFFFLHVITSGHLIHVCRRRRHWIHPQVSYTLERFEDENSVLLLSIIGHAYGINMLCYIVWSAPFNRNIRDFELARRRCRLSNEVQ